MIYTYHNMDLEFQIEPTMWKRFKAVATQHDFSHESGGILIGILRSQLRHFVITDFTTPYQADICNRFAFIRYARGHQEEMDTLWEESERTKTYMGEWHTHAQDNPSPSCIDVRNWRRIAKRKGNSSSVIFIIIGRKQINAWSILDNRLVPLEFFCDLVEEESI